MLYCSIVKRLTAFAFALFFIIASRRRMDKKIDPQAKPTEHTIIPVPDAVTRCQVSSRLIRSEAMTGDHRKGEIL